MGRRLRPEQVLEQKSAGQAMQRQHKWGSPPPGAGGGKVCGKCGMRHAVFASYDEDARPGCDVSPEHTEDHDYDPI